MESSSSRAGPSGLPSPRAQTSLEPPPQSRLFGLGVEASANDDILKLAEVRRELERVRSELRHHADIGTLARRQAAEQMLEAERAVEEARLIRREAHAEQQAVRDARRVLREKLPEQLLQEQKVEHAALERLKEHFGPEVKRAREEEKDAWRLAAEERSWADAEQKAALAVRQEAQKMRMMHLQNEGDLQIVKAEVEDAMWKLRAEEKVAYQVEANVRAEESIILGAIGAGNFEEVAAFARRAWHDERRVAKLEQEIEAMKTSQHQELQQRLDAMTDKAKRDAMIEMKLRRSEQMKKTVALDKELSVAKQEAARQLDRIQQESKLSVQQAIDKMNRTYESETSEKEFKLRTIESTNEDLDRKLRVLRSQLASVHSDWATDIEQLHRRFRSEVNERRLQGEDRENQRRAELLSLRRENDKLMAELLALQTALH